MLGFSLRPGLTLLLFVAFLLARSVSADTVEDIAQTRENLNEIVSLRETLAHEKRAWRQQKELMESQLRLDQQALQLLQTALVELRPQLSALQSETSSVTIELEVSTQLVEFWTGKLEILKRRVSALTHRFPPGLKTDLTPKLNEILTGDYSRDSSKLKRVFDLCLEIVSAANAYHQDIHLLTEIHLLENGQRGEFNVVYLGLSGGYYYSEKAALAGTILWGGSDWDWVEDRSMLADLTSLGAVLSGLEPPRYLSLPMPLVEGGAP